MLSLIGSFNLPQESFVRDSSRLGFILVVALLANDPCSVTVNLPSELKKKIFRRDGLISWNQLQENIWPKCEHANKELRNQSTI